MKAVCGATSAEELSAQWGAGDQAAIAQIEKQLPDAGHTIEELAAESFLDMSPRLERIDRIIMSAETRRNVALREVERHRSSIAAALRRASDEVVDGEFEDVAPDQIARKEVA